ncbi:hypothetical protein DsansV1_C05g0053071 [Dioscorea sansibarensis]
MGSRLRRRREEEEEEEGEDGELGKRERRAQMEKKARKKRAERRTRAVRAMDEAEEQSSWVVVMKDLGGGEVLASLFMATPKPSRSLSLSLSRRLVPRDHCGEVEIQNRSDCHAH